MVDSRVAVFMVDHPQRPSPFLAWASLVGPQVGLLHVPKGDQHVQDGTPCRCQIYDDRGAAETIDATLRRTAVLRSAPPFVFLDSRSDAAVTEVSDPRFWASDLKKVRRAMWDFVALEAESDPAHHPKPSNVAPAGRVASGAYEGESAAALQAAAAKPWWCKLFRSAPGC
jgi:hypothetical protein